MQDVSDLAFSKNTVGSCHLLSWTRPQFGLGAWKVTHRAQCFCLLQKSSNGVQSKASTPGISGVEEKNVETIWSSGWQTDNWKVQHFIIALRSDVDVMFWLNNYGFISLFTGMTSVIIKVTRCFCLPSTGFNVWAEQLSNAPNAKSFGGWPVWRTDW